MAVTYTRVSMDLSGFSQSLGLAPGVAAVAGGALSLLLLGTAVRGLRMVLSPGPRARERWKSTLTWWVLLGAFLAVVMLGRKAVTAAMLAVSLLGLREALALIPLRVPFPAVGVPATILFLWAWVAPRNFFFLILPISLLVLAILEILRRTLTGPAFGRLPWVALGLAIPLLGPLFVVATITLHSGPGFPARAWQGWLLYLLVLTELNDMSQAWWGRALGAHSLAPRISPFKTRAGLVGGLITTTLASLVLGPLLTPVGRISPTGLGGVPWIWSGMLGIVIALAGTAGDLTTSVLKRRAGVKDSGHLLPAQGGILDRFDSLTLSSPVYFVVTWLLWIRP